VARAVARAGQRVPATAEAALPFSDFF